MQKNIPSILDGCIDDLDIDALLKETENDVVAVRSGRCPIPKLDETLIYSHGYTIRVDLKVKNAWWYLAQIGWSESSKGWVHSTLKCSDRSTMRGSVFLTQRGPQLKKNASLAMAKLNRELGTRLYAVEFNRNHAGDDYLILRGVRKRDVECLLEERMGLKPSDYEVAYYLDLERFFVLPPHLAYKLAEGLDPDFTPVAGRGRTHRKRWLLKDFEVPIVIRSRAKRTAKLNIYRIAAGATAQFKVEVALKGRRQNKGHFTAADIPALDAILLQLIQDHDIRPVSKPERWEPRRAPQWRRDGRLARLGAKAYRGRRVSQERIQAAEFGHTPNLRFWVNSSTSRLACPSPSYIRNADSIESPSSSTWSRIAEDISRHDGYLSEVVLSHDQDPVNLVKAIAQGGEEGGTGVGVLAGDPGAGMDTWRSVARMVEEYPATENMKTLVVVVDTSVLVAVDDLVVVSNNGSLRNFSPGPFYDHNWQPTNCSIAMYVKAAAAFFSPMMEELRQLCETTGLRVVIITTDARPQHGRHHLLRTHFFHDARVRSHIGDAGRYFAHTRYLAESDSRGRPTWIGMTKDEAQGLPGRMLWGMPTEE